MLYVVLRELGPEDREFLKAKGLVVPDLAYQSAGVTCNAELDLELTYVSLYLHRSGIFVPCNVPLSQNKRFGYMSKPQFEHVFKSGIP